MERINKDDKNNEMVKVKIGKHNYSLDGYLKCNLDALKKSLKNDYDAFVLIVGREGYGKSTLSFQCALYCDPTFNLSRCCFTIDQFVDAVHKAEKFQAVVFDETMGFLSSRQSMSKFNLALIKIMSEMRSKNLFVFLNIPNFFMMDWYVGNHRTTGMLYTYKRSRFGSYDYRTKKKLYMQGKKFHSYSVAPNFIGRFTKYFPLNKKDYEDKKQEAISQWEDIKHREKKLLEQRNKMIIKCFEKNVYDVEELAEIADLSTKQIRRILNGEK
ncbi:hypothetical protein ES702_02304 [subsurface metagenome]